MDGLIHQSRAGWRLADCPRANTSSRVCLSDMHAFEGQRIAQLQASLHGGEYDTCVRASAVSVQVGG